MAGNILPHTPDTGQLFSPNFNFIATDRRRYFSCDQIVALLEQQYARHLLDNNNHILVVLRHQATRLGISLDYERIAAQLPGPWTFEEYRQANSKAHNCRQRAKLRGLRRPHFTGYDWLRLVDFYDGRCVRCGQYCPTILTVDHVVPLSYGRPLTSNAITNIQPLCDPCHTVKEFLTLILRKPIDYRQSLPDWIKEI